MSPVNYVYQSIARATKDHGTTKMFGLMGDANLFMVDSFVRECGGNFIPAAHEGSTILMAAAYAHVSGECRCCNRNARARSYQLCDHAR